MSARLRIGLFGGTFNPIHCGHLLIATRVRDLLGLDRVIFIPSSQPPHKTEAVAPAADRAAMAQLAVADRSGFEVDDLELGRPGPSYSVDTVEVFRRRYPDADLFFLMGIEMFAEFGTWRHPERLIAACCLAVIARSSRPFAPLAGSPWLGGTSRDVLTAFDKMPGEAVRDLRPAAAVVLVKPTPSDISATEIRRALGEGRPMKNLLPAPVHSYILKQRLYGARDADA